MKDNFVAISHVYVAALPLQIGPAVVATGSGPRVDRTARNEPAWRRWLIASLAAGALQISPALAQNLGQWSGTIPFPNTPVSAAVLPTGKLLTWSSYQPFSFELDNGNAASQTYTSLYDPATGAITPSIENSMMADMFCSGLAYLTDGRLMVNGGANSMHTAIYDPTADTWTSDAMMNIARGYNSTVTLSTGEAFTIGGSWVGDGSPKDGEVWSGAGWR